MKLTTLKDLQGHTFGRLVVLQRAPNVKDRTAWLCRCTCEENAIVIGNKLQQGRTVSCGCKKQEIMSNMAAVGRTNRAHGRTNTTEFRTWTSMLTRCFNPRSEDYPRYGGRGITVCDRWREFKQFLADMGIKPSPRHSIDRINNDGNYEPGNCRWATQTEQSRNRSTTRLLTFHDKTQSVEAWAVEYGIKADTLRHRLARGLSMRKALLRQQ